MLEFIKNAIIKALGGLTKEAKDTLEKQVADLKNANEKVCKSNQDLVKKNTHLTERVNKLESDKESHEHEVMNLEAKIEQLKGETIDPTDKIVIDYNPVYMAKNSVSSLGYYDKGRDFYGQVEFWFYGVGTRNKIIHKLVFNSYNIFSVNGQEFQFGKTKDMKELLQKLIEEKKDILIEEIR